MQLLQSLWLDLSQVVHFVKVLCQVIQLPFIVFECSAGFVVGHGFPAVVHQAAVAEHFKILNVFCCGCISVMQRSGKATARGANAWAVV